MMKPKRIIVVFVILIAMMGSLYAALPYSSSLDLAGDITSALSLVAPAALILQAPPADYVTLGASWSATMLTSYGVRTLLKETVVRARPYVEQTPRPTDTSDDYKSFPSGHTLMAFSSAAYLQTMSSIYYPHSKGVRIATIAGWTAATATGVLRVVSANHHLTDVLAGAAIGSALGFLGPWITSKITADNPKAPTLMVGQTIGVQVGF